MSRRQIVHALTGLGVTVAMSACVAPQVGNPCPIPDNATDAQRTSALLQCNPGIGTLPVPFSLRKDVDILFLIDNSPSMRPKQQALATNIPKFIQAIDSFGANYHVGIATSDIGIDVAEGQLWTNSGTTDITSCNTFAGPEKSQLRARPCTQNSFNDQAGRDACTALCPDARFVPTDGQNFISNIDGVTNVPVNMKTDPMTGKLVDQGPINAFQCMALVGDTGCGVEGQLEASIRALDGRNANFLRSNSILAVIYITDEDDCSVRAAQRTQLNPQTRACDPAQPDNYDCYNLDYRCLARSIQCNESLLTSGPKTGCTERPDSFLEPLSKYYNFFNKLRPQASKLLISGIWTQPSLSNGGVLQIAQTTTVNPNSTTLNRATGTMASCSYSKDSTIFGQAQYRLSKFASQFGTDPQSGQPNALEVSICDIDNYPTALDKIAEALRKRISASCLPVVPKTSNGKPVCLVGDVDVNTPNASPDNGFPVCSTSCCNAFATSANPTPADAAVQSACAGETTDACYCAVKSTVGQCQGQGETGIVAGIWRKNGASAPPGKQANFLCLGGG